MNEDKRKWVKAGMYFYDLNFCGSGKYWFVYQRMEDGTDRLDKKFPYHQEVDAKRYVHEKNNW